MHVRTIIIETNKPKEAITPLQLKSIKHKHVATH